MPPLAFRSDQQERQVDVQDKSIRKLPVKLGPKKGRVHKWWAADHPSEMEIESVLSCPINQYKHKSTRQRRHSPSNVPSVFGAQATLQICPAVYRRLLGKKRWSEKDHTAGVS